MTSRMGQVVLQTMLVVTVAWAGSVDGQDYPKARPLRILTSQVGSGSDIIARIVADKLPGTFGQRAIVDNRGILRPRSLPSHLRTATPCSSTAPRCGSAH